VTPGPEGGVVVGVIGVCVGRDVGVCDGVDVAFGLVAGADVAFAFGKDVDVGVGKVLVVVKWVSLPLAEELLDALELRPVRKGSKAIIAMINMQAAVMISNFPVRRRGFEGGKPVSFVAICGGMGGDVTYCIPSELLDCEN
jgi:hypothetical protein